MFGKLIKLWSNRQLVKAEANSARELLRLQQTTALTPPGSIHPLARTYYDFCERNGIQLPPQLYIGKSLNDCLALPLKDSIFLGEAHIGGMGPELVSSAVGHEMAHILNKDIVITKAAERRADRMAVQMVGAREPVIEFVEDGKKQIEKLIREIEQHPNLSDFERGYQSSFLRTRIKRVYGSHEERIANIRSTNPKDRSQVDRLIAERNNTTSQERT